MITRNHPLGIIGPLLLFLLESVLVSLLAERFAWLPEVLPLTVMGAWFAGQDVVQSAGVWSAWIVACSSSGWCCSNAATPDPVAPAGRIAH